MPIFDPALILDLHAALRRAGIGNNLHYKDLVIFLHSGQKLVTGGLAPEKLEAARDILEEIEFYGNTSGLMANRTVQGPADLTTFLLALKVSLKEIL
jgi:hypothetical protein